MALSPLAIVTQVLTQNAPKGQEAVDLFISKEGLPYWKQIRALFNDLVTNLNEGTLQIFGALVRFGTGVPTQDDPDGSIYVRQDPATSQTFLYYRFGGAWVLFTGGGSINISAGTTNSSATAFSFSNGSGVSFGMNGNTITASVGSGLSNINVSAGTTSNQLSAITFANSNGVSFGLNASTLTASVASSLTNINVSAGTTSNQLSAITFANSNGVSFGLNASTVTASHAINVSAGTTSNLLSALTFANSNGVSFGLNASTVTASHAINVSAGTTSNLLSALTFSNGSNVTFGLNASTLTASVASSLTNINVSAGTTSNLLSAITFANSNGVSFGINLLSVITASVASSLTNINVSAGIASNNLSNVVFSNSNGISFGLNGSTVTASAGARMSHWNNGIGFAAVPVLIGNGVAKLFPIMLQESASYSRADVFMSVSLSVSSNSSHAGTLTAAIGVFTRNASTLSLASSASRTIAWTNTASNSTNSLSGLRSLSFAMNVNASPGDYWVGLWSRTTTANANWITISNVCNASEAWSGEFAANANGTNQMALGLGNFSVSSTTLRNSYAFTDIRGLQSNEMAVPMLNLCNFSA
jgi:hypothetical protein